MPGKNERTMFESITEDLETLARFLQKLDIPDAPWDRAFQEFFCEPCPYDTCPDACPFEEKRYNPEWWLRMPEGK